MLYFSGIFLSPGARTVAVLCINWETAHLYGDAWISHHRLRYRLFVQRQGWSVPSFRDLEHDEFDTPAARYLVWTDKAGKVRGATRLLPTVRPYMVQKLWPELVAEPLPASDAVWEATRFGCEHSLTPVERRRAVAELLCAMQEFGLGNGIELYLAVMPLRLLKCVVIKAGCEVRLLGPPRQVGRFPTVAAYLTVSGRVLAELRRRAGIAAPVLPASVSQAA